MIAAPYASFGPRPRAATMRSRSRRMVDWLRIVLPATALALIALVVLWPQIMGKGGGLIAPILAVGTVDGTDVMLMHNPRYIGRTSEAEPYEVTAASAYLDPKSPQQVHLDQLAADIDRASGRNLQLMALKGVYDRDGEELDLSGGIELITSDGYRLETEAAQIRLEPGDVVGRRPISGSGPTGSLSADRFEIRGNGEVLYFEGRVKVTVPSSALEGGEP